MWLLLLKETLSGEGRNPPITKECLRRTPLEQGLVPITEMMSSVSKPKILYNIRKKSEE